MCFGSAKYERLRAYSKYVIILKLKMEQKNATAKQEKWVKYKTNLQLWS
jgi:hypothetical protein